MRKIKIAVIQLSCGDDAAENIEAAGKLTASAAEKGANLILLPELFERRYFCQERRYEYYSYAKPASENEAVQYFTGLSKKLDAVIPVSFYERDGNVLYNSAAVLDCGKCLGIYRKTHIPDDHYYQEKFYFTPGNTGFRVWKTTFGSVGIGICWDQWFPETARCLALNGAEIILFPSAIGSEPILGCDSSGHWRRVMQGHAAANIVPVAAANRYGLETVFPCPENGGQSSSLEFYGSSFITDCTGGIIASAGRSGDDILTAEFDLDELMEDRLSWGLFRDRRPECYSGISG